MNDILKFVTVDKEKKFGFFFNGTDFRDLLTVEEINRPIASNISNRLNDYISFNGADLISTRRDPLYFKIKYNTVKQNKNAIRNLFANLLVTEELSELYFYDNPDVIYYAKLDGTTEIEEGYNYTKGELTFIIPSACGVCTD